jgi:autotransporter adhesin
VNSIAIGGNVAGGAVVDATSDNGIAIGSLSRVNANSANSVAVGFNNSVTGTNSGAFGTGQTVTGNGSFAIGDPNTVTGNNSFAFGDGNVIAGNNSVAVGNSNTVTANNAVAIGNNTSATFANSVAIGNGATVTRTNQQVFGTASNTYTMPGITSAASAAAQIGPVQIVTSDAGGNLATSTLAGLGIATTNDITNINSRLASMNGQIDDLYNRSNKAYSGVAMAFAMGGVPTLLPHEKVAATLNYGTFQGQSGFAINAAYRLNRDLQLTAGIGYGANENIAGGRVGLRMAW